MKIPNKRTLLKTKNTFIVFILSISITILSVWYYGVGKHQTVIENSLISTSILSVIFFLFLSISLYKGSKLKDNIGKITDKIKTNKIKDLKEFLPTNDISTITFDDDEGIIFSIIFWIIATIVISVLFIYLGAFIWFSILIFLGMLYWIFFRALRLVFKKSAECSGNIEKSVFLRNNLHCFI